MKRMKKTLALLMAVVMLFTTACAPASQTDASSESGKTYNIIFTLATIPPVLAALNSISSGNETYAIIERGKTYSGIEEVEQFHNAGFDPANNQSTGFTATEFDCMVSKVHELSKADKNAFFNFYVQDGTALTGAAIAANAGLKTDRFHIYMMEDGVGTYNFLYSTYIQNQVVNDTTDQPYDTYCAQVDAARAEFEQIMSRHNNALSDAPLSYNIGKAFALAALDQFTYCIQDQSRILEVLSSTGTTKSKLMACFGAEGFQADVDHKLNLSYQKIVDGVAALTPDQKSAYLSLMYGQYYQDTYAALTRTQRADESAPARKLVYIGTRHGEYPTFASNELYGIGTLPLNSSVPTSYADLDSKYKSPLLFSTEEDYNTFLAVLNDPANFSEDMPDGAKEMAKVAAFNRYINYVFSLKFAYLTYGETYDLIMKGHPHEVIGSHEEWGKSYHITYTDGYDYSYNKLMDQVLLNFHRKDSIGKNIGMVPYGTAAENLAYLDTSLSICGLPSSTYNGYDPSVDVVFIMTETDQDISGSGSPEVASSVSSRYEAGNLHYTDENGQSCTTAFYNTGNVLKACAELCQTQGDSAAAGMYQGLYTSWLADVHGTASGLDAQGFPLPAA